MRSRLVWAQQKFRRGFERRSRHNFRAADNLLQDTATGFGRPGELDDTTVENERFADLQDPRLTEIFFRSSLDLKSYHQDHIEEGYPIPVVTYSIFLYI